MDNEKNTEPTKRVLTDADVETCVWIIVSAIYKARTEILNAIYGAQK